MRISNAAVLTLVLMVASVAGAQFSIDKSVWKVTGRRAGGKSGSNPEVGSAFLVDTRGFFLTAAHVVRDKKAPLEDLKIVPPDGSSRKLDFKLVKSWCDFVESNRKCSDGDDVALLKLSAEEDLRSYAVVELHFDSEEYTSGETILASVIGYPANSPIDLPDRTPAGTGYGFALSDNPEPHGTIPKLYYSNDGLIAGGNSGGPALRTVGERQAAIGFVSWGTPDGDHPAVYLVPSMMLYDRLRHLADLQDQSTQALADSINANNSAPHVVVSRLSSMSNIQIAQLFRSLRKQDQETGEIARLDVNDRYVQPLVQITRARRLTLLRPAIPSDAYCDGNLAVVFGCKLEAGREVIRAGDYFAATEGARAARTYYETGADIIRTSLRLKGAQSQARGVLAAAAYDVAYAYAALGRADESITWVATSYKIAPTPTATENLARYYAESSPQRAAYLYQKSYDAGLHEPYVKEGYAFASANAGFEKSMELAAEDPELEAEIRTQIEGLIEKEPDASEVVALAPP